ncbi:MAG: universal stress protein [Caulobacterales bacterium]
MTYAAILTHVQVDSDSAPRLACAVDMAERFGAALIGVGAEMVPPLAFDGGFYSLEADWATAMRESIEGRLKLARANFKTAANALGATATWECGLQLPAPAVAAASRAADLIVAGGTSHKTDPYRDADAGELALISGRPVLVAPPKGPALSGKRIVLAWKDTREARRALTDAMPFLESAEAVQVLAVCPEIDAKNARIQVDDVAAALKRRGAKAEAEVVVHTHPDGFQILRQASQFGADLIVCGAYGHSRMGEWVFGGVTRDLLSQDERYLLLSH